MDKEKEIIWTEDMGFMPPVMRTEGRTICRHECQLTEYKAEIERLREALRYILTHCESDSPPNAKALILFVNNALKEGE